FAMALTALTAQNLGAGNIHRAVNALKLSIIFAFSFGFIFFIWQQLAPQSAIEIFSNDSAVVLEGSRYLKSFSYDYILVPFVFCLNGFFFGCGRTIFAAVNSIFSAFAVRVPVAFLLVFLIPNSGLFEIGIAAPCASVITSIAGAMYLVYLLKGNKLNVVNN
ncbi:MATE family efflux transporter, partial [bacterium]|nr:MATE family efflux transporter [bacterium]